MHDFPRLLTFVFLALTFFTEVARSEDLLHEARGHWLAGRYPEAIKTYEEAQQANADPALVAVGLVNCHLATGNHVAAEAVLSTAIEQQPAARLYAELAVITFQKGDWEEAEQHVTSAMELDSNDLLARWMRLQLLTATGKMSEAERASRWFVRYYNRVQPTDPDELLYVALGSLQYARWRRVHAVFNFVLNEICRDIRKADDRDWRGHHLAGVILLEKFNRAEALDELQQAEKINPRAVPVLNALAAASLQDFQFEQAEEYLDKTFVLSEQDKDALCIKADLNLFEGDYDAALAAIEQAHQVAPKDAEVRGRRIAIQAMLASDTIPVPTWQAWLDQFGQEDFNVGDSSHPVLQLLKKLAADNRSPGEVLFVIGSTFESRKQYAYAEVAYETAIRVMPRHVPTHAALGMLRMRTGDVDAAAPVLDAAFKVDPFHLRLSNTRKVANVVQSYATRRTPHFVIKFNREHDELLADFMADYLEQIYPELIDQFGYTPPGKIPFEIFSRTKGLSGHQWFSARMVGLPGVDTVGASTGLMVAIATPQEGRISYNWAQVAKHELVHVITLQQTQFRMPHWYTEGLAVRSEGYARPAEWDELLLKRVPARDLRTLDNLNLGFLRPKSQDDRQFAYCQALLYTDYIVEQFGEDRLGKLSDAYGRGLTTREAIEEVCETPLENFEAGYLTFLDQLLTTIRRPTGVLDPVDDSDSSDELEDWERQLIEARNAIRQGELTKARELLEELEQEHPDKPVIIVALATVEQLDGLVATARYRLEQALDRSKPRRMILDASASLYRQEGDLVAAADIYALGWEHFPQQLDYLRNSAELEYDIGLWSAAKAHYAELVSKDSSNLLARKRAAYLSLDAGELEETLEFAQEGLYIDVEDPELHWLIGRTSQKLGDTVQALRSMRLAYRFRPEDKAIQRTFVELLIDAGNGREARPILESLLKEQPGDPRLKRLQRRLGG
ncbi:tetratricopeptide repeat protein [Calycomorphotria hydatis]|uniref:Tetratricopeptide repeat protein n=1 Tax=Calycomorphotria hydatis TaxID=2528027 RepID=A0A517T3K3_9PLAN|nr:tetratricopeptide repeat protein [Calycomorphotria hydatis]QDT62962.1 tetratricopeptide repeat protein [Calycomorphotria hydatis]